MWAVPRRVESAVCSGGDLPDQAGPAGRSTGCSPLEIGMLIDGVAGTVAAWTAIYTNHLVRLEDT